MNRTKCMVLINECSSCKTVQSISEKTWKQAYLHRIFTCFDPFQSPILSKNSNFSFMTQNWRWRQIGFNSYKPRAIVLSLIVFWFSPEGESVHPWKRHVKDLIDTWLPITPAQTWHENTTDFWLLGAIGHGNMEKKRTQTEVFFCSFFQVTLHSRATGQWAHVLRACSALIS